MLSLLDRRPEMVERAVVSGVTVEPLPHRAVYAAQSWLTAMMLRSRRLVDAQARALGLPTEVRGAFAGSVRAMTAATYRRITAEVAGCHLPESLGRVRVPTLVLAGATESDLIRRSVRVLPATMPVAAGRIVPGVGHGWNVQAPGLFNATVRAWISGTPLPAALETA